MSFNKIIVVGNLGRDPELRYTPQGDAVCNFTVAVNDKKRDKAGELLDLTTWFKVTLWRRHAENASKYLTKGSQIYIEGRLRVDEWTDRDGKNRYTLEVDATDMRFLGSVRPDSSDSHSENSFSESADVPDTHKSSMASAPTDDDIPF